MSAILSSLPLSLASSFSLSSVVYAAQETSAAAGATSAASATIAQPSFLENMIPFLFIFLIMYLFLIRPQAKKAKEHQGVLSNLKIGDEVVTSSGIIGRVKSISDKFITLEISQGSMKILKEHVLTLTIPS